MAESSLASTGRARPWRGIIEEYRQFLPPLESSPAVSLLEGNTPLFYSPRLSHSLGLEVYLKWEGLNPTGSFKDRGMTVAISQAAAQGARIVICASTGNTAASAAAYAAKANLQAVVLMAQGKVAQGKLAQALAYGATVLAIQGSFDQGLSLVRELSSRHPVVLVNSLNPHRIEGQKTAAFEIVDTLGKAPDLLCIPVGNAGNITAYWKGFTEYHQRGRCENLPRMLGFQAQGAAPIVGGAAVAEPRTIASALRIGNPARWQEAVGAAKDSGGVIWAVSDEEILLAHRELALHDGLYVELASAASVAGLRKAAAQDLVAPGSTAVCVLTGHGLKDYEFTLDLEKIPSIPPTLEAVEERLRE